MFKKFIEKYKLKRNKKIINDILLLAKKYEIDCLTYRDLSYLFGYNDLKYGYNDNIVNSINFEKSPIDGSYKFEIYSYCNDKDNQEYLVSETDDYEDHTCLKFDEYKRIYKYLKTKYK